MGILDDAKELADKAKDLAHGHEDQAKAALDKAGDFVEGKVPDGMKDKVESAEGLISDKLGLDGDKS